MDKPARAQVDSAALPDDKPPQTGNVFNVWYLRWSGGDGSRQIAKLKFKVNVKRDTGYTKANKSKTPTSVICIYFSKGCCYKGSGCSYLHRLPTQTDYYPPTQDCFGRDKTFAHKDDMNGVGVLNKINNTLYIGGLQVGSQNVESSLSRHFGEFGKIVKIKVLPSRNCAFLTYKTEYEAQFAKEAMQNQALDGNEVLMVRWANDDPDPNSQREAQKQLESVTMETVNNLLKRQREPEPEQELDTEEPEIEEPVEELVEQESGDQKLILDTFFDKKSLQLLSSLRKKQKTVPAVPIAPVKSVAEMLGYSSDEE